MGRPVEFIHADVIDNAISAFWREGYESLSANALADAMGVSKSSLYNTYGSKKEVLLHAVAHYADDMSEHVRSLGASSDIAATLRALMLEMTGEAARQHGCLLVNMASELGARDQDVQVQVRSGFGNIQKSLAALLTTGQQAGVIKPGLDCSSYALSLVAGISGIRVLAKSGYTRKQLMPFIDLLLAELE